MHKIIVFPIRLEGSYRKRMRRIAPNFTQDQIQRHEKKKKRCNLDTRFLECFKFERDK